MSSYSEEQKALISLLEALEQGSTTLNRADLIQKSLHLLATIKSENIMVDVEKKLQRSLPASPAPRAQHANSQQKSENKEAETVEGETEAVGAEEENKEKKETVSCEAVAVADVGADDDDVIETIHTISAPCIVSVRSSLAQLFASLGAPQVLLPQQQQQSQQQSAAAVSEETPSSTPAPSATPAANNNNTNNNKKNNANNNNNKKGKGKGGKNNNNSTNDNSATNDTAATTAAQPSEESTATANPTTTTTFGYPHRISSPKHRLLLYRFLLNGLADISGEQQLIMAAGPLFALEATAENPHHKESHVVAVTAVLNGILASSNNGLKSALRLSGGAAAAGDNNDSNNKSVASEEAAGREKEEGDVSPAAEFDDSFARDILLGLVLYFEQKTGSTAFTVPPLSAALSASAAAAAAATTSVPKSSQGRFFDLVTVLSYVVAEGLSGENNKVVTPSLTSQQAEKEKEEQKDGGAETEREKKNEDEEGSVETEREVKKESESEEAASKPCDDLPAVGTSCDDKQDADSSSYGPFLATLFTLLYRVVPLFVPLRGDEQLFASSALPDLLRLLLQYHDPILSMHLDQHPLPRRRASEPKSEEGAKTTDSRRITSVSVVRPARSMADAAYHYLTGLGCAAAFYSIDAADDIATEEGDTNGDGNGATTTATSSTSPSSSSSPLLQKRVAISPASLALLDLIMLRYEDSHYFGCLSFIATVLLRRGSILKLKDGAAIASFWEQFAAGGFATSAADFALSEAPLPQVVALDNAFGDFCQKEAATATEKGDGEVVDSADSENKEKEKKGEEEKEEEEVLFVKKYASALLEFQAHASYRDKVPAVLEPIGGLLLYAAADAKTRKKKTNLLLPYAAFIAVIVRNLAKNTPASARSFATAIFSATDTTSYFSAGKQQSSVNASIAAMMGGDGNGGARDGSSSSSSSSSVSEIIERQRVYVASFPVMPVTAEELALVFPAGGGDPPLPQHQPHEGEGGSSSPSSSSRAAPPSDPLYAASHLQFLVLDSRAENSFLFARLPTAIHIGSGVGFDAQQLAATVFQLQDAWSSHLTIMGTGRTIIEELNLLKLIALRFVEKGFPYVSIVDGGFKACIPYLKAGRMEFTQSPQHVRDAAAAREQAAAAAIARQMERQSENQRQQAGFAHHHHDPNASHTTLSSSEEVIGEVSAQALIIKEQAAVLKDKAAEGLKRTEEKLSEAATSAATWGASVWGKISSTIAKKDDEKEQQQQHQQPASTAPPQPQQSHLSSATPQATAPAPATATAGVGSFFANAFKSVPWETKPSKHEEGEAAVGPASEEGAKKAAASTNAHPTSSAAAAAPSVEPAGEGSFFGSFINKVKETAANVGNKNTDENDGKKKSDEAAQHQLHGRLEVTNDDVFVTTANPNGEDDDDEDLGLILTVAPTAKVVVPTSQSSAVRDRMASGAVPATTTTAASSAAEEAKAEGDAPAPEVPAAAAPASPVKPAPTTAAPTPSKGASTNVIDDLFDNLMTIDAPPAAEKVVVGAAGSASPSASKPTATAPLAHTASVEKKDVFDDIFGDDF